jgi:hypothetical protein
MTGRLAVHWLFTGYHWIEIAQISDIGPIFLSNIAVEVDENGPGR